MKRTCDAIIELSDLTIEGEHALEKYALEGELDIIVEGDFTPFRKGKLDGAWEDSYPDEYSCFDVHDIFVGDLSILEYVTTDVENKIAEKCLIELGD